MISYSRVLSSATVDGDRELKIEQYGTKTADEVSPFGDDGNPIKGMIAVYAETAEVGEPVIIGYINENQLAAPGEKRIYSLKPDKSISTFIWLKNDGTMQLGGDADNLVRYAKLNVALQQTVTELNTELTKISAALLALGGVYAHVPVSLDMSASKITEIKSL